MKDEISGWRHQHTPLKIIKKGTHQDWEGGELDFFKNTHTWVIEKMLRFGLGKMALESCEKERRKKKKKEIERKIKERALEGEKRRVSYFIR